MTVFTSPQGRQRIVVHETKVIWFFTNYQFFEHFGLLHKTTKCGGRSLFSCAVTYNAMQESTYVHHNIVEVIVQFSAAYCLIYDVNTYIILKNVIVCVMCGHSILYLY